MPGESGESSTGGGWKNSGSRSKEGAFPAAAAAAASSLDPQTWLSCLLWPDIPLHASVCCIAVNPQATFLATGTHGGQIYLWQLHTLHRHFAEDCSNSSNTTCRGRRRNREGSSSSDVSGSSSGPGSGDRNRVNATHSSGRSSSPSQVDSDKEDSSISNRNGTAGHNTAAGRSSLRPWPSCDGTCGVAAAAAAGVALAASEAAAANADAVFSSCLSAADWGDTSVASEAATAAAGALAAAESAAAAAAAAATEAASVCVAAAAADKNSDTVSSPLRPVRSRQTAPVAAEAAEGSAEDALAAAADSDTGAPETSAANIAARVFASVFAAQLEESLPLPAVPHLVLLSEWGGAAAVVECDFAIAASAAPLLTETPQTCSSSEEVLVSLHADNRVRLWSIQDGRCFSVVKLMPLYPLLALRVLGDRRFALLYGEAGAFVLDLWTGLCVVHLTLQKPLLRSTCCGVYLNPAAAAADPSLPASAATATLSSGCADEATQLLLQQQQHRPVGSSPQHGFLLPAEQDNEEEEGGLAADREREARGVKAAPAAEKTTHSRFSSCGACGCEQPLPPQLSSWPEIRLLAAAATAPPDCSAAYLRHLQRFFPFCFPAPTSAVCRPSDYLTVPQQQSNRPLSYLQPQQEQQAQQLYDAPVSSYVSAAAVEAAEVVRAVEAAAAAAFPAAAARPTDEQPWGGHEAAAPSKRGRAAAPDKHAWPAALSNDVLVAAITVDGRVAVWSLTAVLQGWSCGGSGSCRNGSLFALAAAAVPSTFSKTESGTSSSQNADDEAGAAAAGATPAAAATSASPFAATATAAAAGGNAEENAVFAIRGQREYTVFAAFSESLTAARQQRAELEQQRQHQLDAVAADLGRRTAGTAADGGGLAQEQVQGRTSGQTRVAAATPADVNRVSSPLFSGSALRKGSLPSSFPERGCCNCSRREAYLKPAFVSEPCCLTDEPLLQEVGGSARSSLVAITATYLVALTPQRLLLWRRRLTAAAGRGASLQYDHILHIFVAPPPQAWYLGEAFSSSCGDSAAGGAVAALLQQLHRQLPQQQKGFHTRGGFEEDGNACGSSSKPLFSPHTAAGTAPQRAPDGHSALTAGRAAGTGTAPAVSGAASDWCGLQVLRFSPGLQGLWAALDARRLEQQQGGGGGGGAAASAQAAVSGSGGLPYAWSFGAAEAVLLAWTTTGMLYAYPLPLYPLEAAVLLRAAGGDAAALAGAAAAAKAGASAAQQLIKGIYVGKLQSDILGGEDTPTPVFFPLTAGQGERSSSSKGGAAAARETDAVSNEPAQCHTNGLLTVGISLRAAERFSATCWAVQDVLPPSPIVKDAKRQEEHQQQQNASQQEQQQQAPQFHQQHPQHYSGALLQTEQPEKLQQQQEASENRRERIESQQEEEFDQQQGEILRTLGLHAVACEVFPSQEREVLRVAGRKKLLWCSSKVSFDLSRVWRLPSTLRQALHRALWPPLPPLLLPEVNALKSSSVLEQQVLRRLLDPHAAGARDGLSKLPRLFQQLLRALYHPQLQLQQQHVILPSAAPQSHAAATAKPSAATALAAAAAPAAAAPAAAAPAAAAPAAATAAAAPLAAWHFSQRGGSEASGARSGRMERSALGFHDDPGGEDSLWSSPPAWRVSSRAAAAPLSPCVSGAGVAPLSQDAAAPAAASSAELLLHAETHALCWCVAETVGRLYLISSFSDGSAVAVCLNLLLKKKKKSQLLHLRKAAVSRTPSTATASEQETQQQQQVQRQLQPHGATQQPEQPGEEEPQQQRQQHTQRLPQQQQERQRGLPKACQDTSASLLVNNRSLGERNTSAEEIQAAAREGREEDAAAAEEAVLYLSGDPSLIAWPRARRLLPSLIQIPTPGTHPLFAAAESSTTPQRSHSRGCKSCAKSSRTRSGSESSSESTSESSSDGCCSSASGMDEALTRPDEIEEAGGGESTGRRARLFAADQQQDKIRTSTERQLLQQRRWVHALLQQQQQGLWGAAARVPLYAEPERVVQTQVTCLLPLSSMLLAGATSRGDVILWQLPAFAVCCFLPRVLPAAAVALLRVLAVCGGQGEAHFDSNCFLAADASGLLSLVDAAKCCCCTDTCSALPPLSGAANCLPAAPAEQLFSRASPGSAQQQAHGVQEQQGGVRWWGREGAGGEQSAGESRGLVESPIYVHYRSAAWTARTAELLRFAPRPCTWGGVFPLERAAGVSDAAALRKVVIDLLSDLICCFTATHYYLWKLQTGRLLYRAPLSRLPGVFAPDVIDSTYSHYQPIFLQNPFLYTASPYLELTSRGLAIGSMQLSSSSSCCRCCFFRAAATDTAAPCKLLRTRAAPGAEEERPGDTETRQAVSADEKTAELRRKSAEAAADVLCVPAGDACVEADAFAPAAGLFDAEAAATIKGSRRSYSGREEEEAALLGCPVLASAAQFCSSGDLDRHRSLPTCPVLLLPLEPLLLGSSSDVGGASEAGGAWGDTAAAAAGNAKAITQAATARSNSNRLVALLRSCAPLLPVGLQPTVDAAVQQLSSFFSPSSLPFVPAAVGAELALSISLPLLLVHGFLLDMHLQHHVAVAAAVAAAAAVCVSASAALLPDAGGSATAEAGSAAAGAAARETRVSTAPAESSRAPEEERRISAASLLATAGEIFLKATQRRESFAMAAQGSCCHQRLLQLSAQLLQMLQLLQLSNPNTGSSSRSRSRFPRYAQRKKEETEQQGQLPCSLREGKTGGASRVLHAVVSAATAAERSALQQAAAVVHAAAHSAMAPAFPDALTTFVLRQLPQQQLLRSSQQQMQTSRQEEPARNPGPRSSAALLLQIQQRFLLGPRPLPSLGQSTAALRALLLSSPAAVNIATLSTDPQEQRQQQPKQQQRQGRQTHHQEPDHGLLIDREKPRRGSCCLISRSSCRLLLSVEAMDLRGLPSLFRLHAPENSGAATVAAAREASTRRSSQLRAAASPGAIRHTGSTIFRSRTFLARLPAAPSVSTPVVGREYDSLLLVRSSAGEARVRSATFSQAALSPAAARAVLAAADAHVWDALDTVYGTAAAVAALPTQGAASLQQQQQEETPRSLRDGEAAAVQASTKADARTAAAADATRTAPAAGGSEGLLLLPLFGGKRSHARGGERTVWVVQQTSSSSSSTAAAAAGKQELERLSLSGDTQEDNTPAQSSSTTRRQSGAQPAAALSWVRLCAAAAAAVCPADLVLSAPSCADMLRMSAAVICSPSTACSMALAFVSLLAAARSLSPAAAAATALTSSSYGLRCSKAQLQRVANAATAATAAFADAALEAFFLSLLPLLPETCFVPQQQQSPRKFPTASAAAQTTASACEDAAVRDVTDAAGAAQNSSVGADALLFVRHPAAAEDGSDDVAGDETGLLPLKTKSAVGSCVWPSLWVLMQWLMRPYQALAWQQQQRHTQLHQQRLPAAQFVGERGLAACSSSNVGRMEGEEPPKSRSNAVYVHLGICQFLRRVICSMPEQHLLQYVDAALLLLARRCRRLSAEEKRAAGRGNNGSNGAAAARAAAAAAEAAASAAARRGEAYFSSAFFWEDSEESVPVSAAAAAKQEEQQQQSQQACSNLFHAAPVAVVGFLPSFAAPDDSDGEGASARSRRDEEAALALLALMLYERPGLSYIGSVNVAALTGHQLALTFLTAAAPGAAGGRAAAGGGEGFAVADDFFTSSSTTGQLRGGSGGAAATVTAGNNLPAALLCIELFALGLGITWQPACLFTREIALVMDRYLPRNFADKLLVATVHDGPLEPDEAFLCQFIAVTFALTLHAEWRSSSKIILARLAGSHMPLFVRAMGRIAKATELHPEVSTAALSTLMYLVLRMPDAAPDVLPDVVEAIVRCLDPAEPQLRRRALTAATAALFQLVRCFPMTTFHQQTQRFAVGCVDSFVILYDLRTATKWKVLEGHAGAVSCVSFSEDGSLIGSYSAHDGTMRLWQCSSSGFFGGILGIAGKPHKVFNLPPCGSSIFWQSPRYQLATIRMMQKSKTEWLLRREDGKSYVVLAD